MLQLDEQLCFALYAASRAVTRAYRPALALLGLTYPQYLVMLVLWETDDVGVKFIGDRLMLDSGTVTPLIRRLQAGGWLTRARDERDDRRVRIQLTPAGRALAERAPTVPLSLLCKMGAADGERLARMRTELKSLIDRLRDPEMETTEDRT